MGDSEPSLAEQVSIRTMCEAAIETQDPDLLPVIKAQVNGLPTGSHKTNARRWLALAHVLVAPETLSPSAIATARQLVSGMPDETPHKSAALDMLAGLEGQPAA